MCGRSAPSIGAGFGAASLAANLFPAKSASFRTPRVLTFPPFSQMESPDRGPQSCDGRKLP